MANAVRSPMVADVGARIRSLRIAKGLTQAQLAEPNYTKAYVSMLESGRTRASMKALEHMAGILGVTPADLLGGPAAAAAPQYELIEARRLVEQGKASEALPILERLEEGLPPNDQVVRLRYLASAYHGLGRPKDAYPILERAQRMADMLGDVEETARLKSVLAAVFRSTYAYDESSKLLREIIALCDDGTIRDPAFHFRRVVDLAVTLTNQRQSKAALAMFERALELSANFADRNTLGFMYAGMAKAYHDAGDVEAAIRYNQRSLQVYEELGLLRQVACTLDNAAMLYADYGNRERARECLERGAQVATDAGSEGTLASIRVSEAEVMAKSDTAEALEAAQEALRFAKRIDQPDAQVRALVLIGELRMPSSITTARRSFNEAAQMAEARVPHLLRVVYDRWSRAAETSGDGEEALRLARRALELVRA